MTEPRLFLQQRLATGEEVRIGEGRAHYLLHVLRLREGAELLVFNPTDGEWLARIAVAGRRDLTIRIAERRRPPALEPGPTLAFAPIRRNRLEWLVEKAVELGAARLVPVLTRRTQVRPERTDRLEAIATEAAEQCERLTVPTIDAPVALDTWLGRTDGLAPILFADERGEGAPLLDAMRTAPAAILLVGPEGGFTPEERTLLRGAVSVVPVSLGPRILRAETAAIVALTAWQLAHGGT